MRGLEVCGARKGFPLGPPGPDPSQCLHLLSPSSCLADDGSRLLNTLLLSGRRQCVLEVVWGSSVSSVPSGETI